MAQVTVIGGGCIGLSTALALEEAGHTVRILAAHTGEEITSFVAGAVWFPFRCSPPGPVNEWSRRTRDWLTRIARERPEAGVDVLTFFHVAEDDSRPWFADSAPDLRFTRDLPMKPLPPAGVSIGAWRFPAPRVEPAIFMPWLAARLRAKVERRRIGSLAEAPGEVIINCTGLGARALTGDRTLQGLYGHVLVCEPGDIDMGISISDDRAPEGLLYTIPRRTTVVVGGCSEPSPDERPLTPDPAMREAILARCDAAELRPGRILREVAGLRPFRPTVRLERETLPDGRPVIHNYGHGGAGYTMMRACAEDAVQLIERR